MDALSKGPGHTPQADVVLASMPFGVLRSPSLGLGILQARLSAAGITTRCRHLTLDYAAHIGTDLYDRIASGLPRTTDLLGEWIFSHALEGKDPARQELYIARTFATAGSGQADERRAAVIETVLQLAASAREFVAYAANEILRYRPKVVGLTSVFQQNVATLAVATRLRCLEPSVKLVVGGANCEGPMGRELARTFRAFDAVVSGEADLVIVPLVQSLLDDERLGSSVRLRPHLDGITETGGFVQTKIVPDLNDYVAPSFEDYFEDVRRLWPGADDFEVQIPMETSRGCWWGVKKHCTFCGLNGSTMTFRSRPPDQALRAIVDVSERHPGARICFVDNIMDYRYFDSLLPRLAERGTKLDLFYEIKSNVTKAQVRALKEAGVNHIQPGIESLSDEVLTIMGKGVSAIQNLQLLKWCMEFAVEADWNLLWGFPGESPAEYGRMARLVPLITHLQPPARGSRIRLDRFSPNFTRSAELGFRNLRPYEAYRDVYDGAPEDAVFNLAYFFEADAEGSDQVDAYTGGLRDAIDRWRTCHRTSGLTYLEKDGRVVVVDSRSEQPERKVDLLDELQSSIYRLCDTARPLSAIAKQMPDTPAHEIAHALEGLCGQGLMWSDGMRYLSLAVSFTTFLASRRGKSIEDAIDGMLSDHGEAR